jgi:CDP-paratose 2-epimerase
MGLKLRYRYEDTHRTGDHICYITDLKKVRAHFPGWKLEYDLPRILTSISERQMAKAAV